MTIHTMKMLSTFLMCLVLIGAMLGFGGESWAGKTVLVQDWMGWDDHQRMLYVMGAIDSAMTVLSFNPEGEMTMNVDPGIPEMNYYQISDHLLSQALANPDLLKKPFIFVLLNLFTFMSSPDSPNEYVLNPHEVGLLQEQ